MADIVIQWRGTIYEHGYGLIAQKVMRDKSLHAVAKAIYAYLAAFAGQDGQAFPSVELMMDELGIKSKDTFYKYRNQLINAGYITVEEQQRIKGQFYNNVYILEVTPQEKQKAPCPKSSTTVKSTSKKSKSKKPATTNNRPSKVSAPNKEQISTTDAVVETDNEVVEETKRMIESHLKVSTRSIEPMIPLWIRKYGKDNLISKAQFISERRHKWNNILGAYRASIEEEWDIASEPKPYRDDRYAKFYELFPDS